MSLQALLEPNAWVFGAMVAAVLVYSEPTRFWLLASMPILEELVRTLRYCRQREQQRCQAGLATIK